MEQEHFSDVSDHRLDPGVSSSPLGGVNLSQLVFLHFSQTCKLMSVVTTFRDLALATQEPWPQLCSQPA